MGAEGCTVGVAMCPQSLFWKEFTVICLIITHLLEKGLKLKSDWKIITFLLHCLSYLSPWRIFAVNSG